MRTSPVTPMLRLLPISTSSYGSMMVELGDAVKEIEDWPDGRGLVVSGDNGQFCSGGDLTFMNRIANSEDGVRMSTFMQDVTHRLAALPLVSVAMLEGHTLGGGAELAMACDNRLMAENAQIGFVQSTLGVSPGWGGISLLRLRLSYALALELLSSGKTLDFRAAREKGIVEAQLLNSTNSDQDLEAAAASWLLENRLSRHREANRQIKLALWKAYTSSSSMEESLQMERDSFGKLWGSRDHLRVLEKIFKKEK